MESAEIMPIPLSPHTKKIIIKLPFPWNILPHFSFPRANQTFSDQWPQAHRPGRGGGARLHLAPARPARRARPAPPRRAPRPRAQALSLRVRASSPGSGTSFPRHLIKLTMCCYLHADLPGFLSSCSQPWSFSASWWHSGPLNAIFVRPRCALIDDVLLPSNFSFCSIYKALL